MEFEIPKDLVEGHEYLPLGIPWQVLESIYKTDENLSINDHVLEVGTGGSTVFFSRRCATVLGIETSEEWFKDVQLRLGKDGAENVTIAVMSNEDDIVKMLQNVVLNITVLSIDSQGGYNRSRILNAALSNPSIINNLRMLILDNYSHEGLFPDHHDKIVIDSPDWEVFTYNHPRWAGDGTRLYIKKNQ